MKKLVCLILALLMIWSLTACGQEKEAAPVDLNALYESFEQYMPEMFYPDEATLMYFLGIDAQDCAQYQVAVCAEGMRADEVWLIEAKDAAALERLHQMAQTRIAAKLDETVSYVPDQYEIVEKAEIIVNGRYLALLISPDVDALKAGFEKAVK